MLNKWIVASAFAMTAALPAHAQNNQWVAVVKGNSIQYSVKENTFRKESESQPAAGYRTSAVFRRHNRITDNIEIVTLAVTESQCWKGYGVLSYWDASSRTSDAENFAFGAGNIASILAEYLCKEGADMIPEDQLTSMEHIFISAGSKPPTWKQRERNKRNADQKASKTKPTQM